VWHQVRASGFTFCVPASWKPSGHAHDSVDANLWTGEGGAVNWDLGRPATPHRGVRGEYMITGSIVTVTRSNDPVHLPPTQTLAPGKPIRLCSPRTNTPFLVDGMSLMLTQIECQGTWTTTAWSTTPAIYVQGEAHSVKGAKLLGRVIQTIRFTSPPR
jgi:hypothetical protein